jgi:hypothetical protein
MASGTLRGVIAAIVKHDAFRSRRAATPAEVTK